MDRPVIVSGLGRTGTTWVGKTLCLSGKLFYVHEPGGAYSSPPRWPMDRLPVRSFYICRENENEYIERLADVFRLKYPLGNRIRELKSFGAALLTARQYASAILARARDVPVLIKDPGLFFSMPWLADRFGPQVIITIRHPASVISSIKRMGWKANFHNWLDQPLLMRDYLGDFESQLNERIRSTRDAIADGILLWNMYYTTARKFQEAYPSWIFVRHEDLAIDPVAGFSRLYARLGLDCNKAVESKIQSLTGRGNPVEGELNKTWSIKRDSRATTKTWLSRLTAAEIARIREGVANVSDWYYDPEDWAV